MRSAVNAAAKSVEYLHNLWDKEIHKLMGRVEKEIEMSIVYGGFSVDISLSDGEKMFEDFLIARFRKAGYEINKSEGSIIISWATSID